MRIVETIAGFIEHYQLMDHERLQLVAISGGADSVCLLRVLLQLGYHIEAIHCNFHLRGDESNRDEQFVKELCKKLAIELHLTHFDTKTYSELHKVSIEMAARELRYHYFEQLRHDLNAECVCVAHHQDDSVETILMNLLRGTGIHGLTGIKPRNGNIVRPLLCVSRQDIELWLASIRQQYVTDSTNLVADVVRNKIRLNVLPQLNDITPSATTNILTTARRLAEAERVYDDAISHQLEHLKNDDSIEIQQLLQQPSPEAILYAWLAPVGFSPSTIESITSRLPMVQAGRQWCSSTHQLIVHQGRLTLDANQAPLPSLNIPETGNYLFNDDKECLRLHIREGSHIERDTHAASLDASKVCFPLTLRPIQAGDRFQPFGMRGMKLVSDYLTDRHISLPEKRRQLVITDATARIVWLVSHRPDQRFCVDTNTTKTLIIHHERR